MDDCWFAEPNDDELDDDDDDELDDDEVPADWLAVDEVDGCGAVADAGPFGRIIMVAFFNV